MNRSGLLLLALLGLCGGCAHGLDGPTSGTPAIRRQGKAEVREVDPRWRDFGAYLGTVNQSVETEWRKWNPGAGDFPAIVSLVQIHWVMNSSGEVSEIKSIRPTPGTPPPAVAACVDAIKVSGPFPPWTPAMVAVLGEQQELTLQFEYR